MVVNQLAFFPSTSSVPHADQLPTGVRHQFIATADGEKIELYIVAGASNQTALLYFHGNGGNIAQRVPELQKLAAVTQATVIGVGYRGYGASTGHATEAGIYRDGEAAYGFVRGELGFPEEQIVVIGRSLGSTVATWLAARHHPKVVVLVTPLSTGADFAKAHGASVLSAIAAGRFDNLARAGAIAAPTLVLHGSDDEVVPYANGQALFAALTAPKRFVAIEHGRHNNLEFVAPDTFWNAIAEFVAAPPVAGP